MRLATGKKIDVIVPLGLGIPSPGGESVPTQSSRGGTNANAH